MAVKLATLCLSLAFTLAVTQYAAAETVEGGWTVVTTDYLASAEECDSKLLGMLEEDMLKSEVGLKAKRKDEAQVITAPGNLILTTTNKNAFQKYERFMCDKNKMLSLEAKEL